MNEAEWFSSDDPGAMLEHVKDKISSRRLRLFACGCCRQVWGRLTDDAPCPACEQYRKEGIKNCGGYYPGCDGSGRVNRSRLAVEVAERFADGLATIEEIGAAWASVWPLDDSEPDMVAETCEEEAAYAARAWTTPKGLALVPPAAQAALLRCIAGNPWRPVRLPGRECWRCEGKKVALGAGPDRGNPKCGECDGTGWLVKCDWLTWNGGTVPRLAQAIYNERRWEDMPILADALEEAGCGDEAILGHCRETVECALGTAYWGGPHPDVCCCNGTGRLPAPHARGCWVLDLLLGKD